MTEPASLLEEIRFGYGPRAGWPLAPDGLDPDRVLAQLAAADPDAAAWTGPTLAQRFVALEQRAARKKGQATPDTGLDLKQETERSVLAFVTRPAAARLGFVERLVNLWSNRLTIGAAPGTLQLAPHFRDEAIRPRIAGRYADLLRAALWHPAMHVYLSQTSSVGPNSDIGRRKGRGLNENLAREFLELHSMGTGYDQRDVTELARLLAGMATDATGPHVDPRRAEPGEKTILAATYTGGIEEIDRLVETVALRPETAQAVALTLARHFIDDAPPADLTAALAASYRQTGGDLPALYRTLLTHPASRNPARTKLRSPQDYMAATLRAVGLTGDPAATPAFARRGMRPAEVMARMGQPPFGARRPDGWPEVAAGWLTPPMLAARLDWAADLARLVGDRADPVAQTRALLGDTASPLLLAAVAGAEQRWEGLAVLLGSPDFMRR